MKNLNFFIVVFLATMLCASPSLAQNQVGQLLENTTQNFQNFMSVISFEIKDYVAPGCETNDEFLYSVKFQYEPYEFASGDNIVNFPSLPGGNGPKQFTIRIEYIIWANSGANSYVHRQTPVEWDIYVNGELCENCIDDVLTIQDIQCSQTAIQEVTFTHEAGSGWVNGGVQQIALRPKQIGMAWGCFDVCTEWCWWDSDECCEVEPVGWLDYTYTQPGNVNHMDFQAPEIRFWAVFTGVTFTDVIGTFDTPEHLTCILRDPPGDQSYGEWTETTNQCFGTTTYGGTGTNSSQWSEVQVGIGGSFLGFDYEVYASGGVSASIENELTNTYEYLTCIESTQTVTTGDSGEPDDLFIGSALTYDYGMGRTIYWEDCVAYYKDGFAMRPVSTISTFALTESAIRQNKIPQVEEEIESLEVGSDPWKDAVAQLNAWEEMLELNDEIKAEASGGTIKSFNSTNGAAVSHSSVVTTSETKSIDMVVRLDNGLDFEYGSSIGCCEVLEGGSFNIRTEFGSTTTATNVYTSEMTYKLGDDDVVDADDGLVDEFSVRVMPDPVFGSYVFELIEDESRTSCPYEGGYQIEQPLLWVNNEFDTTMTLEDVPIGTTATFPLILCNDSDVPVEYLLSLETTSNPGNAQITAFGFNLVENDNAYLQINPGACISGSLDLEQSNINNLVYEDIKIQLLSGCGDDISSSIYISAFFGSSVGINDLTGAIGWFTLSPNPSNGIFRLAPKGTTPELNILVTDMTGRTVVSPFLATGTGSVEIDLSHLGAGMYILVAESKGERRSTRLMLEK